MNKKLKKIYSVGAFVLAVGAVVACSEEEPINMAPTFSLNEVSNIMRTSATFSGSIDGNMSQIKEYGFQYSLTEDFSANLTWEEKVGDTPSSGLCQATVKGLEANERYYYRLYATTGASKVYSYTEYFQTTASSAPLLSEVVVDSIGENMARFVCSIEDVGDEHLIEYGIGYKTAADKSYIPIVSDSVVSRTANGTVQTYFVQIEGLSPATKYSFRPYAKNSADANAESGTREGYGTVSDYQTENLLSAEVTTSEIADGHIGINTVQVTGTVKSAKGSNGVVNKCGFCWSENNTTPVITDSFLEMDPVAVGKSFTTTITDLKPGTTYYVRAFAKNTVNGAERVGYGETYTITTEGLVTPKIEADEGVDENGWWISPYESTATTITFKATITNYDEGALIEKGFIWSKTTGSITLEKAKEENTFLALDLKVGGKSISGTIEKLEMNTRYYVRAYAIYKAAGLEEVGYTNNTYEIRTSDFQAPSLSSVDVKEVTVNSALFVGGMNSEGNATMVEKGFCAIATNDWIEPKLTTEGVIIVKSDDDEFTETVDSLKHDTHYYVSSYAITSIAERNDTTYSWPNSFRTSNIEQPQIKNIEWISATTHSVTVSCGVEDLGDGELIEKGIIYLKDPFDGYWKNPDFSDENNYTSSQVSTEGTNESFTLEVTGLDINTQYYFRAYFKMRYAGEEYYAYSNSQPWSTENYSLPNHGSPIIDNDSITYSSAVVEANIQDEGNCTIIKKGFLISKADVDYYPTLTSHLYNIELGLEDAFRTKILNLTYGTRYAVRSYVVCKLDNDEEQKYYSEVNEFSTSSPNGPTFNGIQVDSTSVTSIAVSCGIDEEGTGEIIEKGFLWKIMPNDDWNWLEPTFETGEGYAGNDGSVAVTNGDVSSFSHAIPSLVPGTYYYVRSYVKVTVDGLDFVFYSGTTRTSTQGLSISLNFNADTETTCTISGTVNNMPSSVTEFGFYYCTEDEYESNYTMANSVKATDLNANKEFTASMTDLLPNTRYYVSFYIKIGEKIYRNDSLWDFTTKRKPSASDNVSPDKKEE